MTKTPNGFTIGHDDHGLTQEHLELIDQELEGVEDFFVIKHIELPEGTPDLMSALYGPTAGDEPVEEGAVFYEARGNRAGPSRLVVRPHRPCRNMVLIALPQKGFIITAYGTQADSPSPREWWDAGMKPHEAIEAAQFWSQHALAN
jgi:hypothetical protein